MGRAPCCDKANVKKGPWSPEEDSKLKDYIEKYGTGGNWIALPQKVGLKRCGKSCRLRWLNYLRPNIKHGEFSDEEDRIICTLYATIGSRWSIIAAQLPGRTDNDIKNYWNTKLKKKLMGIIMPSPNQKTKFLNPTYPPPLQTYQSQFPSLPSLPSLSFKDCSPFFNPITNTKPLESPQIIQNLMNNNNAYNNYNFTTCFDTNFSLFPSQEMSLFGPMQGCNGNHPQVKERLLMFGGDQASCSSNSDGSCSIGREIKQEEMGIYIPNGGFEENPNPKFVIDYGKNGAGGDQTLLNASGGYFGNNGGVGVTNNNIGLDDQYGGGSLEEVKQLISGSGTNNDLYFDGNDQNKTQQDQRTMYYY